MQDLLSMDWVEAFVVVATTGSVTQAAAMLYRSQPAISQRIHQLEDALDTQLFERQGRVLVLTDEGKRLLKLVQPLLQQWRALPEMMSDDETVEGVVTLGAFSTTVRHVLSHALIETMLTYPRVRCVVQTGLAGGLFQHLRAGSIDVLYLIGDMDIQGMEVLHLSDIAMTVVFSPQMWPHDEPPDVAFLQTQRLALWKGALDASFAMVERHVRSLGWVDDLTYEVPHIETLKLLAQSGVCFTILPDYVIHEVDGLRKVPLMGFDKTFPLRRYTIANRYQSRATRQVMAMIESMIGI